MPDKPPSLQDIFLNECRRAKQPVTIFLMKGVKLQGQITWFDAFSVLLRRDGIGQLVYKHAISTIMPAEMPDLAAANGAGAGGAGKPRLSLQDRFLDAAEREAAAMTIFLVNGVMLQGVVGAHDQFALLLTRGEQGQLVYKHAVSTMQPGKALNLGDGGDEAAGEGEAS